MVNSKVNLALCLWERIGIYKARCVKMTSLDLSSMLMVDVLKHADIELESEVLMLIYLQEGQVR
jgi:hypothetical protein